jgi:polyisoprenoid-binding protein YceI
MKKSLVASLATAVLATLGSVSLSHADTYNLDSVHSVVVFQIQHFASEPYGVFHGPEGTVTLDGKVPSKLEVSVPVAKLDLGNPKWEEDIKSASWFDVKQFPDITFKSTSIENKGENKESQEENYEVTGDLTLHGVTKSITVKLVKIGEAKGMQGEQRLGYSTEFKVNRSEFGMTTLVNKGVGDAVVLRVNLEVIKQ